MILIIAYGNSLRHDDGAGLILAEHLEARWLEQGVDVERIAVHQLGPELALDIAREEVEAVIFVDTRDARTERQTPGKFPVLTQPLTATTGQNSLGHHFQPCTILVYARDLYAYAPTAWLVTVPGVNFEHGGGLSEVAHQALQSLPNIADDLLHQIQAPREQVA